jgi:MULE transposase domain/MuDR family transposase
VFNEQLDFGIPIKIYLGMKFSSPAVFRKALKAFHVSNGCDYKFVKNDGQKESAKCKSDCGWYIYASWSHDKNYFQIKRFDEKHRCGRVYKHSKVGYKWICLQYFDILKVSPDLKANALQALVLTQHGLGVSLRQCYRAKQRALVIIEGEEKEQYLHIRDYCEALIHWNLGTTAKVETDNSVFKRYYICLVACKIGFLQGCRPIIGVDACHLKGRTSGQLMVAVGKDGNENMFPIAYAVVEGETKETWAWFLTLLIEDIESVEEYGWTFISDRQKVTLSYSKTCAPL